MKYLLQLIFMLLNVPSILFADRGDFENVSLQLQWKHQFQFAGYYIAKEKGFYKEIGLKVDIKEFSSGITTLNEVKQYKATYGIGRASLIIDQSNDANIKLLSAIFQSSPSVFLSIKDSGITSIKDFEDKKIMITTDVSQSAAINVMMKQNNVLIDDMVKVKHSFDIEDLINRKTDVMASYISNEPFLLEQKNIEYTVFDPKDYGYDFYSDILFTSKNEIINHKQRAIHFREASLKGWEYAFENIEETVDIILKKYNTQNKSKQALTYEANVLKKLAYYKNGKLGNININKIKRIYDIYNLLGLINNKVNFEELIFNSKHNGINFTFDEEQFIQKHKIIKMCNYSDLSPLEFANNGSQNEMKGVSIDTLRLIENKVNIKFINVPTSSIIESQKFLKEKKCDILPISSKNPLLEKHVNFSKPYLSLPMVIFTHKDDSLQSKLEDLDGKVIAQLNGSSYVTKLQKSYPSIKVITGNSVKELLELVNTKQAYATIGPAPVAIELLYKYALDNVRISGYTSTIIDYHIAVRNDDILLLNILNKSLDQISKKQHDMIYKKWVTAVVKEKVADYTLIWKILIIVLLILLAGFYSQFVLRKLNKKLEEQVLLKTQDLKNINADLEKRINYEVESNRKKDALMYEQAKLASMGEMIGNIAHQWRQPLSVISIGVTGMKLKKEYGDLSDKEFSYTCDVVNTNTQFLSRTIDDFRDYIKGSSKKVEVNLQDNISSFIKLVDSTTKEYNINLILDLDENIVIEGYPNQLIQCYINIYNNAKDALLKNNNEDNRYIFISKKIIDDNIVIVFRDNAGGIDDDILPKIFEPYFTTKHQSQGTGLGLHMTYNLIINSMDGTLESKNIEYTYKNNNLKGVEFIISLPCGKKAV